MIGGVAPNMSHPTNWHLPVPFTARCPGCGEESSWTTTFSNKGRRAVQGSFGPEHHIDCPKCGPCPCGNHEAVTGVPA